MKRILTSLLMAVGITGPFVSHLVAQDKGMVADIPFAFVVNNRELPAGRYDLSQWTSGKATFALRDAAQGSTTFVQLGVHESGDPHKPMLAFACNGKDCVVAAIRAAGGEAVCPKGSDSLMAAGKPAAQ